MMSEDAIRALLGARLATEQSLDYPEKRLLLDILIRWGLWDYNYYTVPSEVKQFISDLLRLLDDLFTKRVLDNKDAYRVGYATKVKYIPLSLSEVLKELLKRVLAFLYGHEVGRL